MEAAAQGRTETDPASQKLKSAHRLLHQSEAPTLPKRFPYHVFKEPMAAVLTDCRLLHHLEIALKTGWWDGYVSTGKQVNKPSDNPYAAGRILADRTTISAYAQYMSNIEDADTWISTGNANLELVNTQLTDAQSCVTTESSWSSSNTSSTVTYLQQLYNQVLDVANTKTGSTYMYGGNNSTTPPFTDTVDVTGGTASNVIFGLAGNASNVTVTIKDTAGNVVRTLTPAGGTAGTNTTSWDGKDSSGNLLPDGTYNFTVSATDSSGNAVAEYAAYRGDSGGKTVMIGGNSTCTLNNNGDKIFTKALSSLSQAITALQNGSYSSALSSALGNSLQIAITQVQSEEVSLSNAQSQMTTTNTRLSNLTTTIQNDLTTIETGSATEASVKLTTQETNYEATMAAISNVLKMSNLTSFLS